MCKYCERRTCEIRLGSAGTSVAPQPGHHKEHIREYDSYG